MSAIGHLSDFMTPIMVGLFGCCMYDDFFIFSKKNVSRLKMVLLLVALLSIFYSSQKLLITWIYS